MEQFIREPECQKITGLSRPTRWRLERPINFLNGIKSAPNAVGWLSSEIEDWIQTRRKSLFIINHSREKKKRVTP